MKVTFETIDNISDEQLDEITNTLLLLAKRRNPNVSWWAAEKSSTVFCNICEQIIFNTNINNSIEYQIKLFDHMFFHLEEHKLLVFL
jgi:hypothetical protein